MAIRGWTSSVASREPQVLRAPCTVIFGICARVMRRSKLRRGRLWELPDNHVGQIGGKTQQVTPGIACASLRELVLWLINGYAAITATCWLPMVRRRSTVRFRKEAPGQKAFP